MTGPRYVQRLTMLIFFLQPIAFGSWLPRIPDIQGFLGLGPAALAFALLGLPCGTLLTLPFAGPLVEKLGARRAIWLGFIFYCVAISLPGFSTSVPFLFGALLLTGSSMSFLELGLNVKADRVEKATGDGIMSRSHGFWSLGIMAGSIIGSVLAGVGVPPQWAIMGVSILTLPFALLTAGKLPDYGRRPASPSVTRTSRWRMPDWALIGISLFVFGITMTEGAIADWSAVFLRTIFSASPAEAGLGYSVFALMVASGRFGGDYLRKRFGAVALARVCGVLAIVGVATLLAAPTSVVALVGFAVVGLGVSVGFPLAVTAAAALTGRASSTNLAVLSFIALLGFLVGPPVIGFIAEHVEMRLGLAALVPFLVISLLLTGRLSPKPQHPLEENPESRVPGVL
ncbi:MFS transporter [Devosia rhodophyticola]|uniref:MFS transporter n=1 Tax=Devosia rhodophyticola TaxID=3026423 RepID=A0ABY7YWY6_9HYPH|nr:MFS transporter [Devosia rhodophyticola]WDR05871.1 MFS transporter [Devosia rhodophyticola]